MDLGPSFAIPLASSEGSLTFLSTPPRCPHHVNSDVSAPPGGFFLGFFDEVDAASGARGDWRRDPDGNDGAAGAVS